MKKILTSLSLSTLLACSLTFSTWFTAFAPAAQAAEPAAKLYFNPKGCASKQFSIDGDSITQAKGASCKVPANKFTPVSSEQDFDDANVLQKYGKKLVTAHGLSDLAPAANFSVAQDDGEYYLIPFVNNSVFLTSGAFKHLNLQGQTGLVSALKLDTFSLAKGAYLEQIRVSAKQATIAGTIDNVTFNGEFVQEPGSLVRRYVGATLKDSATPLNVTQQAGAYANALHAVCRAKLNGLTSLVVRAQYVEVGPQALLPEVVVGLKEVVLHKDPKNFAGSDILPYLLPQTAQDFALDLTYNLNSKTAPKVTNALKKVFASQPVHKVNFVSDGGTLVVDVPAGKTYELNLNKVGVFGFSKLEKRGEGRLRILGSNRPMLNMQSEKDSYYDKFETTQFTNQPLTLSGTTQLEIQNSPDVEINLPSNTVTILAPEFHNFTEAIYGDDIPLAYREHESVYADFSNPYQGVEDNCR